MYPLISTLQYTANMLPEQRIGQIISNATRGCDLFNVNDEALEVLIREYVDTMLKLTNV